MSDERSSSEELSRGGDQLAGGVDAANSIASQIRQAQSVSNATSSGASAVGSGAGTSSASAGATGAAGASSASGAAAGTAAGTSAGSAGGPVGAIIGAAVGLLLKPAVKLIYVLIIIGLLLISVFMSLPGVIFRDATDVLDKDAMMERYNGVIDPIIKKYQDEILIELHLQMASDSVITARAIGADYDSYSLHMTVAPPDAQMVAQLRSYANMIICMYEIRTKDWWISPIWLADFLRWLDLLFVDFVEIQKDIDVQVTTTNEGTAEYPDYHTHADIYITYTMKDKGIPHFQKIYGLDDKQMAQAEYMKKNLDELVGVSGGSGSSEMGGNDMVDGVVTGGSTHQNIKNALEGKEKAFYGGAVQCPLDHYNYISSKYGYRDFPADPYHTGIDLQADKNTPIKAAMDGEVLYIGNSPGGFGKHVVLYHGGNVTTMYAHMNKFGAIEVGMPVKAGDVIGYVGRTGLSTGDHLHFEYQLNGAPQNPNLYYPFY